MQKEYNATVVNINRRKADLQDILLSIDEYKAADFTMSEQWEEFSNAVYKAIKCLDTILV